jgi:hypothetical protein
VSSPHRNWMVSAVRKFQGGLGLRVVRQQLLISIDATSMCVHTQAPCQFTGWLISSKDDRGSNRSLSTIKSSAPDCIQRFSVIQGMTAIGKSLPLTGVVTGACWCRDTQTEPPRAALCNVSTWSPTTADEGRAARKDGP